jgi:CheY-like chemotaxis protein
VLVVDDSADNLEMYSEYLRSVGFAVESARDGATAIMLAREMLPSLIVMELALPEIDGWKATRILKSTSATQEIPIIVLSAHAGDSARARAVLAGCDLFLTKPTLPSDLAVHVRRLMGGRRGRYGRTSTDRGRGK